MKLGYPETLLTPSEAFFIQKSLLLVHTEDELRRRIRVARLHWAMSVAPNDLLDSWRGKEGAEVFIPALMTSEHREDTREAISISLDNVELSIVRSVARVTVERAKEHAMLTDQQYDDFHNSNKDSEEKLHSDDAEVIKSSEFEEALRDIHMGRFIIGAIDEYYPE